MVFATRTDKICKELVAVVHDLSEYRFITGFMFQWVLPHAGRNTSRDQD